MMDTRMSKTRKEYLSNTKMYRRWGDEVKPVNLKDIWYRTSNINNYLYLTPPKLFKNEVEKFNNKYISDINYTTKTLARTLMILGLFHHIGIIKSGPQLGSYCLYLLLGHKHKLYGRDNMKNRIKLWEQLQKETKILHYILKEGEKLHSKLTKLGLEIVHNFATKITEIKRIKLDD